MSDVITRQAATIGPEQLRSLNDQVAHLGTGVSFMAVLADGQVYVRATDGLPQTLIELWLRNPAMMIPDSAGYRTETRAVSVTDL
jgi:hypothetical protein